jgi:protein-L-isoaspartate(D-aspartate) O-methyltransferase
MRAACAQNRECKVMNADFSVQRAMMIEGQLRTQDVTYVPLLEAMREIPREAFVPGRRKSLAYIDEDLEVAAPAGGTPARYLMEPARFGRLVQLARVRPSDLVLDVGCATGYSTAILSKLASFVVALECDEELAESAASALAALDCINTTVVTGNLEEGHNAEAPYDVIFLEGAVDYVPDSLLGQLAEGGRLVAVIGEGNAARAHLFIKEDGIVSSRTEFNAAIKPLPGFKKEVGFVF